MFKQLATQALVIVGGYAVGFVGAVAVIEGIERLADRIELRRAAKRVMLNDTDVLHGEYRVV